MIFIVYGFTVFGVVSTVACVEIMRRAWIDGWHGATAEADRADIARLTARLAPARDDLSRGPVSHRSDQTARTKLDYLARHRRYELLARTFLAPVPVDQFNVVIGRPPLSLGLAA